MAHDNHVDNSTEALLPHTQESLEEYPIHHQPVKSEKSKQLCYNILKIIGVLCFIAYIFITAPFLISAISERSHASFPTFTCGTTIDEAIARGCTFDELTSRWLPRQCSRTGEEEFLAAGYNSSVEQQPDPKDGTSWRYYEFANKSQEFVGGLRTAPLGDKIFLSTGAEHFAHCAWMLIRSVEGRMTGKPLDPLSSSLEHTRHCALLLLEHTQYSPKYNTLSTFGAIDVGYC